MSQRSVLTLFFFDCVACDIIAIIPTIINPIENTAKFSTLFDIVSIMFQVVKIAKHLKNFQQKVNKVALILSDLIKNCDICYIAQLDKSDAV